MSLNKMAYIVAKVDGKDCLVTVEIPTDASTDLNREVSVKETATYRTNKVKIIQIEGDHSAYIWIPYATKEIKVGDVIEDNTFGEDVELENYDEDGEYWPDYVQGGIKFYLDKDAAWFSVFEVGRPRDVTRAEDAYYLQVTSYENGLYTGPYYKWFENGQLHEETAYVNGFMNGPYKRWHVTGEIREECTYDMGNIVGLYRRWWPNGQLETRAHYLHRHIDGLSESWYPNGQKAHEVTYVGGLKHGIEYKWYEDGKPEYQWEFVNGKLLNDPKHYKHWDRQGNLKVF